MAKKQMYCVFKIDVVKCLDKTPNGRAESERADSWSYVFRPFKEYGLVDSKGVLDIFSKHIKIDVGQPIKSYLIDKNNVINCYIEYSSILMSGSKILVFKQFDSEFSEVKDGQIYSYNSVSNLAKKTKRDDDGGYLEIYENSRIHRIIKNLIYAQLQANSRSIF
jgi:hypothetical protein